MGILTNLRRCCLQSNTIERLNFVGKNWPNDPKVSCKPPFNLLKLLENYLDLQKEFESSFEQDESVDI